MDTYRVKGADGKTYKVRAPSPEAAASAVRTMLAADAPAAPAAPAARSGNTLVDVLRSGVGQGLGFGFGDEAEARVRSLFDDRSYGELRDDIRGQNQAFRSDNPLLAYGSEITGALAPTLAAAVATPFTGGAAGGGAAVGAGRIGAAASKLLPKGRLARAATVGAAQGGVSGAGYADENKLEGAAVGAGLGAGIGGVGAAVLPKLQKGAKELIDQGVTLTPGQAVGGMLNRGEEALGSVPFFGGTIRDARRRGDDQYFTVAANRALGVIGKSLKKPKSGKLTPEQIVEQVEAGVNKAYDDAAAQINLRGNGAQVFRDLMREELRDVDQTVQNSVKAALKEVLEDLPAPKGATLRRAFDQALNPPKPQTQFADDFESLFPRLGTPPRPTVPTLEAIDLSGAEIQRIAAMLRRKARGKKRSGLTAERNMLDGLAKKLIERGGAATGGNAARAMTLANTAFRESKILRSAFDKVDFDTAPSANIVKRARDKNIKDFGPNPTTASFQEPDDLAARAMKNYMGDSGTADRGAMMAVLSGLGAALGVGTMNPMAVFGPLAMAGAVASPYATRPTTAALRQGLLAPGRITQALGGRFGGMIGGANAQE